MSTTKYISIYAFLLVISCICTLDIEKSENSLKNIQIAENSSNENQWKPVNGHNYESYNYFTRILSSASTENTEASSHFGRNQTTMFTTAQMAILFIFFGLLLGMIVREANKSAHIPFAPIVILVSIAIGSINERLSVVGETVQTMINIDPHTCLAIFIVPIVFESAFDADAFVMKRNAWAIFMVSFPGAIITSFQLALVFKYLFWYEEELSFDMCVVLGSMLAITDPVAIGDTLKHSHVQKKFALLLEGESHFTDGSAFVIFMIALHSVVHGTFDWGDAIVYFIQLTQGGIGMGIVFAIPVIFWLNTMTTDLTLGVMITISTAWLTFFVSEFVLNVSGILALEIFGLLLSAYSKRYISEKLVHSIETIWGILTSCVETQLYILAGLFIGDVISKTSATNSNIHKSDIWKFFIIYFFVFTIRFIVCAIIWPTLKLAKSRYGFKELIGFTWGGLRGVMSIVLALIVVADTEAGNERFRDLCVYFASFTVLMSMVINDMTVEWVWGKIGLINSTPAHGQWLHMCEEEHLHKNIESFWKTKKQYATRFARWKDVQLQSGLTNHAEKKVAEITSLFAVMTIKKDKKPEKKLTKSMTTFKTQKTDMCLEKHSKDSFTYQNIIEEIRLKFYNLVQKYALEKKEASSMDADVYILIRHMSILRKGELSEPFDFHDLLKEEISNAGIKDMKKMFKWIKKPFIGKYIRSFIIKHIKNGYLQAYNLKKIFTELIDDSKELAEESFIKDGEPLWNKALKQVILEIYDDLNSVTVLKDNFSNFFPEIVSLAHTQGVASLIIKLNIERMQVMARQQILSKEEIHDMLEAEHKLLTKIRNFLPKSLTSSGNQVVSIQITTQFPGLRFLDSKQVAEIERTKTLHEIKVGEKILDETNENDLNKVYLLEKGFGIRTFDTLDKDKSKKPLNDQLNADRNILNNGKGPGSMIGISNVISKDLGFVTNMIANTKKDKDFKMYTISGQKLLTFMNQSRSFEEDCLKSAHEEWIRWQELTYKFNPFIGIPNKCLYIVSQHTSLVKLVKGQSTNLIFGGYIYEGKAERNIGKNTLNNQRSTYIFSSHNIILPSSVPVIALEHCSILRYDQDILEPRKLDRAYIWTYKTKFDFEKKGGKKINLNKPKNINKMYDFSDKQHEKEDITKVLSAMKESINLIETNSAENTFKKLVHKKSENTEDNCTNENLCKLVYTLYIEQMLSMPKNRKELAEVLTQYAEQKLVNSMENYHLHRLYDAFNHNL